MASGRAKWALIAVAVLLLLGLWAAAFLIAASTISDRSAGPVEWSEQVVRDGPDAKVAMVPIIGEIFSDPEGLQPGASDENVIGMLEQAENDPSVEAIILELDTPGGGVVASDNIYKKVKSLRDNGLPVIALMRDTAASGGYYIGAAADEIVANPATITGSIGVIMFLPNLEGTAEKLGIRPIVFKSGPHKDILSPFREIQPDEQQMVQRIIDEAYGQFVAAIVAGRQMEESRVRELGDGRIYTGQQAKDLGLVDHLGGIEVAVGRLQDLADVGEPTVVRYFREPSVFEGLLGFTTRNDPAKAVADQLSPVLSPGLKYLWLN